MSSYLSSLGWQQKTGNSRRVVVNWPKAQQKTVDEMTTKDCFDSRSKTVEDRNTTAELKTTVIIIVPTVLSIVSLHLALSYQISWFSRLVVNGWLNSMFFSAFWAASGKDHVIWIWQFMSHSQWKGMALAAQNALRGWIERISVQCFCWRVLLASEVRGSC